MKNSWKQTGIMTDDFGIVTKDDIKGNLAIARPAHNGEPHLVWLCLPVEHFTTFCNDLGWVVDLGEKGYYSGFTVVSGGNEYDFMRGKFSGHELCVEDKRNWTKLVKGETACFSAFYVGEEPSDKVGIKKWSLWNIERVKSKKGEWSYSGGRITANR